MPSSRRNSPGYLLPTNPQPENRRYVCVPVPDDERHIQAFLAQIDMLGYWYTWERDTARTARLAASVWVEIARDVRNAFYADEGCNVTGLLDVRQNSIFPCKLEKTDDGETWTQFANLRLCTPLIRWNGTIQEVSTDDGETWTPVEVVPPVVTPREGQSQSIRCIASANASNVLRQVYEEVDRQFLSGASPYIIASAIITFIALLIFYPISLPLVIEFFLLVYATFETLGSGSYTAQVEEDMKCIFYCASEANDGVVTFDYAQVLSGVQAKESPLDPIWTILAYIIQIVGENGLNSAGTTTAISNADCGDCDDCNDWCYTFNSSTGWADWSGTAYSQGARLVGGEWHENTATGGYWYVQPFLNLPGEGAYDGTITEISFTGQCDYVYGEEGNTAGCSGWNIGVWINGSVTFPQGFSVLTRNATHTRTITGNWANVTGLHLDIQQCPSPGSGIPGTGRIWECTIKGKGVCPFGEPNC